MNFSEVFLLAMVMIFAVPYAIWRVGNTDYYAPLVVIQIITGILLGPGILGRALPNYYHFVFNSNVVQALNGIALWAVAMYVWIAGIELDARQVWRCKRESGITVGLALGVPLLFGAAVAAVLVGRPGWVGQNAAPWQFMLGVGMACAVTALPILVLLMQKLDILRKPIGQRILRYGSLDDVAIWAVLAVLLMDWERFGKQIGFFAIFGATSIAFRRFMRWLKEGDRWYVALIWLALCGFTADRLGLHYMVGAYLAGVVIDSDWFDQKQLDSLRDNVLLVAMPVFFLSTGLRTDWKVGGVAVFLTAGVLLLASVGGKLAGVKLAGRILGWRAHEASLIGWLLQTKALIMIAFILVLLDKKMITSEAFTALLVMAVVSTMLTVPIVAPKLRRMSGLIERSW